MVISFLPHLHRDIICSGSHKTLERGLCRPQWHTPTLQSLCGSDWGSNRHSLVSGSWYQHAVKEFCSEKQQGQQTRRSQYNPQMPLPISAPVPENYCDLVLCIQQQRRWSQPKKLCWCPHRHSKTPEKAEGSASPAVPMSQHYFQSNPLQNDLPTSYFPMLLLPSFVQFELWWYEEYLQRCKLWKSVNLHCPFQTWQPCLNDLSAQAFSHNCFAAAFSAFWSRENRIHSMKKCGVFFVFVFLTYQYILKYNRRELH